MPLFGPNGRLLESYKKAPPPKLGPAFGQWAGRDLMYAQLPGGGVLGFDLSKLTLTDYRMMRENYQINASLSVLSFMLHQLDWRIECTDSKIATMIETNMRQIWTRLIRGMSQAYWSGYSPMVLEYENDIVGRRIILAKVKDLPPEECTVNWKKVEGYAPPGMAKPKLNVYDGFKQIGAPVAVPPENCVHPDTPVLCADLVWRAAGTLVVGQKIIAFDEDDTHLRGGKGGRRYRSAEIVVNNAGRKASVEIRTDVGDPIVTSHDHPFMVRVRATRLGRTRDLLTGRMVKTEGVVHYTDHWAWVNAVDLKPGDKIAHFGNPDGWKYDDSREAGWVAGMFDGEGSISKTQLSISQNSGVVLDQLKSILAEKGFEFYATPNTRDRCVQLNLRGGVREVARFLAVFRPIRLMTNFPNLLDGAWLKINKSVDLAVIESVEDVGDQPIASIQTSCGTFITGGYTSHNSMWYSLLMENGDFYGRKLLRNAFVPWYFSNIVHLFANRYYERFGEPVPVGRAPFDADIEDVDGNIIGGKQAMDDILLNLRNRSVVTLPSERDPVTKEYDYNIEFLESQMRGADFERYLSRLDEEMSLGIFTPVLLFRTADVGSYNLGVGHMQLFMWMLNALAGDMKEYIDRYVITRLKDFNFGPKSPRATWEYRQMGKENVETVRAMLTELIRNDRAKPDLRQLGEIAGLTLTEVQSVTEDSEDESDEIDPDRRTGRSRDTDDTGPRGVGQPRQTTRAISNRVRSQIEKAWRDRTFGPGFEPSFGYKKRFEEALRFEGASAVAAKKMTDDFYGKLSSWTREAIDIGAESYADPGDFMAMFDRYLDVEIGNVGTS